MLCLCQLLLFLVPLVADDDKTCVPEAYQFQNFPDVNLRPLLAYNFVTSIPSLNQTATIDGVLTWLNSTHQDEAPDQLSPIEGHTGISGVGSIAYFGTFNGSLFSGYNGVPVAILSNFTFPIPDSSSKCTLYMEAVLRFKSLYPYNITSCAGRANDPFYGSGIVTAIDQKNWLEFGFMLTNHKIYGLYARWPNGWSLRTPDTNYGSFVYMIPLADRQPDQFNQVTLMFDQRTKIVRYLIESRIAMTLRKVGLRIDAKFLTNDFGGIPFLVYPIDLAFEMGLMTPTRAGLVKGACQGLYDPCAGAINGDQPVEDAWATVCRYIQPQNQLTYNITMSLTMKRFSISTACQMPVACPCFVPPINP